MMTTTDNRTNRTVTDTTTYAMFIREGRAWRQFAYLGLREAEGCIERGTGRIIAVDPDTGIIAASSHAKDYGKNVSEVRS